jgi:hypothetical protein
MVCPIFIVHSEIVDYELNSPFSYLRLVIDNNHSFFDLLVSSTWVRLGASPKRAPSERRSSPVNQASLPSKEFESPLVVPPINDIETFLTGLRFEKRNLLAGLPSDLLEDRLDQATWG